MACPFATIGGGLGFLFVSTLTLVVRTSCCGWRDATNLLGGCADGSGGGGGGNGSCPLATGGFAFEGTAVAGADGCCRFGVLLLYSVFFSFREVLLLL